MGSRSFDLISVHKSSDKGFQKTESVSLSMEL